MDGGCDKGKGKVVISKDKQCPWVLLFSKTDQDEDWTIKTYESEHTCGTARKVRACTAKFLANNIVQQIEGNPTIPVRALRECACVKRISHGQIGYCLEWIREYLMVRLVTVDKEIAKCNGSLTPTAQDILDENKNATTQLKCVFNGTDKYQVTGQWMDQYVVNLQQKTCSCRQWDITGIPCKHAIAAMNDKMENGEECGEPEDWVHKCYWLSTWKAMYSHKIEPINGKDMWPQSSCPIPIIPPNHHVQAGRPKKKRTKAVDEPSSQGKHLSRKHLTVTRSKCHKKGHNSRSCKGQSDGDEVAKASKKKKGSK